MPINSSALVSGRESLSLEVVAGFENVAIRTGGGVQTPLTVSAHIASNEQEDAYEYRNMEVAARVSFLPQVRDSVGRLKWAPDDSRSD